MVGPRPMESQYAPGDARVDTSAKQLISRYESLRNHEANDGAGRASSDSRRARVFSASTMKEKLPGRQSFRNLIGLFRKSDRPKTDITTLASPILPVDLTVTTSATLLEHHQSSSGNRSPSPSDVVISGSLLYLSQTSSAACISSPILPVWTTSDVTLTNNHLVIQRQTSLGNPDILKIPLEPCTDVRSISNSQLHPEERGLLPKINGEEPKLFELLFAGRPRELFATSSVRTRANWVNAIWGIILPTAPNETHNQTPSGSLSPSSFSVKTERELPAIPCSPDAEVLALYDDKINTPSSRLTTSPSIVDLNQKSMVTRRLSQLKESSDQKVVDTPSRQNSVKTFLWTPENVSTTEDILPIYKTRSEAKGEGPAGADKAMISSMLHIPGLPNVREGRIVPADMKSLSILFRQQAQAYEQRTSEIKEEVFLLRKDVQNISLLDNQAALVNIQNTISNLGDRNVGTDANLRSIRAKLEELSEGLKTRQDSTTAESVSAVKTLLCSEMLAIKSQVDTLTGVSIVAQPEASDSVDADDKNTQAQDLLETKLSEILDILKAEVNEQTVQHQQQADSVRYLNELNSWLEAFVNNGTSQIQNMSHNVDRLCTAVGCSQDTGGLQTDLRTVAEGMRKRDEKLETLQHAIHNLHLQLSQTKGADTQSLVALVDRQRQDHEDLLKALAGELSNEIRGERLRFVEAMKAATTINVQTHVEQLKSELKKEVQEMTQQVGKLYKERQKIENQIAELFAFHSKQQKAGMDSSASMTAESEYTRSISADPRALPNPYKYNKY